MRNSTALVDVLDKVATDWLPIPSFLFRGIRNKLIKMILATNNGHISPLNYEGMRLLEEANYSHY